MILIFYGVVIRPGWVFGINQASLGHFDGIFSGSLKGRNRERKYSWVHIDDLGESYVAAVNYISNAKGHVFNIVNNYDNIRHYDLVKRGSELAGINFEWIDSDGMELIDNTSVLHAAKAMNLLHWTPKIFGLFDHLEFYYNCYRNAIEDKQH